VQSGAHAERADEAGGEAVHPGERPVTPQVRFMSGELVSTRGGIRTAAEAAEMAANPPKFQGQTHGKVNARQGVHLTPPSKRSYACEDCRDLEARINKAFKDMGYEF
jgi:hypothetical protein